MLGYELQPELIAPVHRLLPVLGMAYPHLSWNVAQGIRRRLMAVFRDGQVCARHIEAGSEDRTLAGVLLLAHGGPGSLEDVPAFLQRVRGGRPCSEQLLDEVRGKYRSIGGASPLPGITHSTAGKLEKACGLPVYTGMLHWPPLLEDAIPRMVLDGISRALVICLVPHFSGLSVGGYYRRTAAAAGEHGLAIDFVDSWCTLPPYIEGLADSIVASWGEQGLGAQTHVVFSAHSLPKAALSEGDPYAAQLMDTADLVAGKLGLPQGGWTVAYQGARDTGEEWLGPSVHEVIRGLSEQGETQVVLCPLGFIADQVEILYDLDVSLKEEAAEMGVSVSRTSLLNDGPALVDSLSVLVDRWRG